MTNRPHHDVKAVREATDIVKLVSQYIVLKRVDARGRHVGLCPFHRDKTPSLSVDQVKGLYHCFACGAGGDVITFLMESESLTFPEALRRLAERAGISSSEGLSRSQRRRYALAVAGADELAERLVDFVLGLGVMMQQPLDRLSGFLSNNGIDPTEALHEFHRGLYILGMATPIEVANTWLAIKYPDPNVVDRIARIGYDDRTHAEYVTTLLVELLGRAQEGNVAA